MQKYQVNSSKGHLLGYPISLLTPKTAPPCPSKDLRVLPRGTLRSIESSPTCPDPPNVRVPPWGPWGGTSGLALMKSRPTRPAFSGTFGAQPQSTPRSTESTPTCPIPRNIRVKPWGPWGGTPFWTH